MELTSVLSMELTKTSISFDDFSKICHVCLLPNDLVPFIQPELRNVYESLTNIKIEEDDKLLKNVCRGCIKELENIVTFIETCKDNYSVLKIILLDQEKNVNLNPSLSPGYDLPDFINIHDEVQVKTENVEGNGTKYVKIDDGNEDSPKKAEGNSKETDKRKCKICNEVFNKFGFANHMKMHAVDKKKFTCTFCNKNFQINCRLKRHMRIHTAHKNTYKAENRGNFKETDKRECKICNQMIHKFGLGSHMKTHTEEKKFICTFCNKNFQKFSHLERHIRIHTDERPYACKFCNRTFRQNGNLKKHALIHTGEISRIKPFQCHYCGKQFYAMKALDAHVAFHTGVERPDNYKCNICKKSFIHRSVLKRHMRSHTGEKPFLCTICGKSFSSNMSLKIHTRIHTGEKPVVCSHCNKGYTNSTSLKRHIMRNHTYEKPYVCVICHKDFNHPWDLKRHTKRMHPDVVEVEKDTEAVVSDPAL